MHRAFKVHMLNENGKNKAVAIAEAFDTLLTRLREIEPTLIDGHSGPGGREMAIAATKLEEASFFAKKAMASQAHNMEGT